MKKVLITGANSYIGMSFEKYAKENTDFEIDTLDMLNPNWRNYDFSKYDTVFHVAGIAHIKETKENSHLYYKVNRDLAIETATIAKTKGVKQFIFLSSMSVYGMITGVITNETLPNPNNSYGKSKHQAEKEIEKLSNNTFKVCIVRPPMVYGDGCKGNYQSLVKFANKFPVFPRVNNQRSMISVQNLSIFVLNLMKTESNGLFLPQDSEYHCTSKMVKELRNKYGKRMYLSFVLGVLVIMIRPFSVKIKKAFGNLVYSKQNDNI